MTSINAAISGSFRLNSIGGAQATSFQRLSTGLQINSAADNPAGLIASESLGARGAELESQIRAISRQSDQLNISEAAIAASRPGVDSVVERAEIGIRQRQSDSDRRVAETEAINTAAARSAIRDADYGKESSSLASGSVRAKATIYAINASRQAQASIIDLLA
ncbi:MAG: flagellin [Phycisphaerales bacterium]